MKKEEFIAQLRKELSGLPKKELEERLTFYSEMIDDRMEDGLTEQDAVSDIGSVEEISTQIISDIPFTKIAKEKITKQRRFKNWEILLLALGAPIWVSLAIAAVAVLFSLFVAVFSVVFSVAVALIATFVAVLVSGVGGVLVGIFYLFSGNALSGVALIGASIFCAGLSILFFYVGKALVKAMPALIKKTIVGVKRLFIKKEKAL